MWLNTGCLIVALATSGVVSSSQKSLDGLDLPAPSGPGLATDAPIITDALGKPLAEVSQHVMSAAKSEAALKRMSGGTITTAWFAPNFHNADVAGFDLTEGCVTRIVLLYKSPTRTRIAGLEKQLAASGARNVEIERTQLAGSAGAPSLLINFRVDPVEWYLSRHQANAEIAAAMRGRRYVVGMNSEQMDVIGDGPGRYRAIFRRKWHSGGTASSGGPLFDPRIGQPADPNEEREETFAAESKAEAKKRAEAFAARTDAIQLKSIERIPLSAPQEYHAETSKAKDKNAADGPKQDNQP